MQKKKVKLTIASTTSTQNSGLFDILIPAKFPDLKYREAMDFIAFVTSPAGQKIIEDYVKHGVNLFYPDAIPVGARGEKKRRKIG